MLWGHRRGSWAWKEETGRSWVGRLPVAGCDGRGVGAGLDSVSLCRSWEEAQLTGS